MDPFRLSWGQRAHFDHLTRNGLVSRGTPLTGVWRFPGSTDVDSVVSALKYLVQRHEALRTSYLLESEKSGSPVTSLVRQQVFPERPLAFETVDCRSGELARECAVAVMANQRPILDPWQVPALPVTLFRTPSGIEAVAVSVPHHTVDANGFQKLGEEFRWALGFRNDGPAPAAWQPRHQVSLEANQRWTMASLATRGYLESVLARTPLVYLTGRRPRDRWRTSSARAWSMVLAPQIARIAHSSRCSAASVMSTLVMAMLAVHTGERVVLIRSSYARHPPHRAPYVAPSTLTALLHMEIPAHCTVADLLDLGRRAAIRGYTNANYDPAALAALEIEHSHSIGHPLDGFCGFDFGGKFAGWGVSHPVDQVGFSSAGPRFPDQVVMTVEEDVVLPLPMRFAFTCSRARDSGAMELELLTDNELIGVPAGAFLERLMRFAAFVAENQSDSLRDALRFGPVW